MSGGTWLWGGSISADKLEEASLSKKMISLTSLVRRMVNIMIEAR